MVIACASANPAGNNTASTVQAATRRKAIIPWAIVGFLRAASVFRGGNDKFMGTSHGCFKH
jgi:hypothetical protein